MTSTLAQQLADARPAAVAVCRRLLGTVEDAEDCVSHAVESALGAPPPRDVKAWLITVSRRRAIDLVRRREAERRALRTAPMPEATGDAADAVVDRLTAQWLWRQAATLPVTTQTVLRGTVDGVAVDDLARMAGLTRRATESHLLRARRHLRAAWHGSLVAVTGIVVALRRGMRVVAPTAVAAVGAAFALSMPSAPVPASAPAVAVRPAPVALVPDAHTTQLHPTTPVHTAPAGHVATTKVATSDRHEIGSVRTPLTRTSVRSEDRGGPDGVVATVVSCAENFQADMQRVGC